jgi:hypothetical protein
MHEPLESYLEEIRRYLAGTEGVDEILDEIRSHLLEKTEAEHGAVDDASLAAVIAAYGTPRAVAAQYLDGGSIIDPVYRRHVFRYLGYLFGFHLLLVAIAFLTGGSFYVIPIFYVPRMDPLTALIYVPMAFVYDCGLIALFFYLVSRRGLEPNLIRSRRRRRRRWGTLRPPRVLGLVGLLAVFGVASYFYVRYHTVFFYTRNFEPPVSLLDPTASLVYSGLFVAALACETLCYALRFVNNSPLIRILRDVAIMLLLWAAWIVPIRPQLRPVPGIEGFPTMTAILGMIIIIVVLRFLKDLALVTRMRPLRDLP